MNVSEFLENERCRPFVWGETDCATTADRWFNIVNGYSPMLQFGRTIANEEFGRAWLVQFGGLVRGVRAVMRYSRVASLIGTPNDGDIGVIIVDNRACIAIYSCDVWHSRDEDGFIFADDSHRYVAWEVSPCRKHY